MSKGKKITVFSIVGVVLALVVVVIVLACVPSYFNNFIPNKCSSIIVYHKGLEINEYISQEEISKSNYETYLKLNDAVKNASSEKILTAMFQGSYKFNSKLISEQKNSSSMETLLGNKEKTFLVFDYISEQSVTIDGTEVKFYSLIMEVSNVDYLTEAKIYFQKNKKATAPKNMESDYQTTILANQGSLYNMIENLA